MQLLVRIDVKCHEENKSLTFVLYVFFYCYEEIHLNNEAGNEKHFRAADSV
jgi:hypothetical protein